MNKIVFLLFVLILFGGGISVSQAAEGEEKAVLSQRTYERLIEVHRLIEERQVTEALQALDTLLPELEGEAYETSVIHQTYGYAYIGIDDFPKAITSFKAALALDALPEEPALRILYDLAQLYISIERYEPGAEAVERWLIKTPNPTPEAHALAAGAYIPLNRFAIAIPHLREAIILSPTPKEEWYQSLLGLHYELMEYQEATRLLKTIILKFPDKSIYWSQLSNLYLTLKEDAKGLAILELAYMKGFLEEKDLVLLASLYQYQEVPHKAGILLEKGISEGSIQSTKENWEKLSDAWFQAKELERAVIALERAAKLSDDGKLDVRRGTLLVELERWEEAVQALEAGLSKGEMKNSGRAHLLLGIASNALGEPERAITSFKKAKASPDTRRSATQWLAFLQVEKASE